MAIKSSSSSLSLSLSSTSPSWTPNTMYDLLNGPHYAILDHFNEIGAEEVRTEILMSPMNLMQKLEPAQTTGDAQLQSLLQQFAAGSIDSETVISTSRGDKSTFLPQHVRERDTFQSAHPQLSHLLQTMEATVRRNATSAFDLTDTVSVQLAIYPGDRFSGYPQHCDVSGACSTAGGNESKVGTTTKLARILTAIYYLTPSDWSATDDGGHLQLVLSDSTHYDVVPYSNRFLIFRSDKVPHQVLPSKRRDRLAITMWFYGSANVTEALKPSHIPSMSTSISLQSANGKSTMELPPPLSLTGGEADKASTIFVSIASFRDSETVPTIQALFETARFPNRIVVGLVLQCDPQQDQGIVNHHLLRDDSRIRMMTLHAKDARGPCYARHLAQLLYNDEDYILQIDSHMRFRNNWDTYLIDQLSLCDDSDKAVLTTYPVGYTLPNEIPNEVRPTILVPWKFDDSGVLRQRGRLLKATHEQPIPLQPLGYAAGFNFCRGSSSIPQYPTWNIFFGEEVFRAVQFHQAGYQFFAPAETVVYHLWSRNHRPVYTSSAAVPSDDSLATLSAAPDTKEKTKNSGAAGQEALRAYLNEHVSEDTWKAMGVNWREKRLLESASSCWSEDNFARKDATILSPDSWEGQVAGLEPAAQALIQSFLGQIGI